MKKANECEKS